ncbi:unnamed protein product [Lupinus luteus]|uniref:Uncharacterized protein n=1 Tax=Lupinus luteus TaxID=3873 RepID=A0AAV1VR15_LUPLU
MTHMFISAPTCHMTWLPKCEVDEQVARVILSKWLSILDLLRVLILIVAGFLSLIPTIVLILLVIAKRLQNRT